MVHLGPWAGDDIYIYKYVVYEMYTYKDYIYIYIYDGQCCYSFICMYRSKSFINRLYIYNSTIYK